ncbi:hypothetical protein PPL_07732 [Heterostelium album PN500]|uniref:Uncharacterized protein n=1 Tax=Heterostelium pallidum (strain ATCC 26659 / Pp 5 / PN500) TaxID=670386 RepID=D3BGT0_HETP5|nr:hypothetical protein PPL_07732 [Heterostelium album PN500]EFA79314.1 hypothetical protein PPL_07732 [Heterostelium album PN500]|eukprot:XP_020431435.1 hypothetical protein PPL_07732 [Heterostelium album PN500]
MIFGIQLPRANNNYTNQSTFTIVSPPLTTITIHQGNNNINSNSKNSDRSIGTRVPEKLEIYIIRKDSDGLGSALEENLSKILGTRVTCGYPPPQMPLPPPLHLTAEKRSLILYVVPEESYHYNNDEEAGYFYCSETDEFSLLQIGATFNNHLLGYLVIRSTRSQSIMVSQYPDSACEDASIRLGNVPPLVSNLKMTLTKDNSIEQNDIFVSKSIERLKQLITKRQSA